MTSAPIKQYRAKKILRWIKAKLLTQNFITKQLVSKWQKIDAPPNKKSSLSLSINDHEYSLFSQNGEDGILRYIFSVIGFESRYFVEFGFGAHQCNSLRLILHEDFRGLFMDGSKEQCDIFNQACRKIRKTDTIALNAFINKDNLESLISSNKPPAEIDLLSIDVDGNDYWFWEVINCVHPRVVCIEYNSGIGNKLAWSIPYKHDFERFTFHPSGFFAGASLKALEELGMKKGYRLIGCDSTGTNAFFLRDDLGLDKIKTLSSKEAFYPHLNWLKRGISEEQQLEIMSSMPYEEV